jgi:hypothetical protein
MRDTSNIETVQYQVLRASHDHVQSIKGPRITNRETDSPLRLSPQIPITGPPDPGTRNATKSTFLTALTQFWSIKRHKAKNQTQY